MRIPSTCTTRALRLLLSFGILAGCDQAPPPGRDSATSGLAAQLPTLTARSGIPGLQVAVVEAGRLAWSASFGVANADDETPVTAETVFQAASLSKPILAYIALRMADRGELDLDRPLHELLAYERFGDHPHARALTARLVLSHQGGLPNWGGDPLAFDFAPGTRFGYSGEGYVYLQRVIEAVTGSTLEEIAQREVFTPLGMVNSRFTWAEGSPPPTLASGHDEIGEVVSYGRPEANAASSLHATAEDYARFVIALLAGEGVDPSLLRSAWQPVVRMDGDERNASYTADLAGKVGWGLGWGTQDATNPEEGEAIVWHWGDNGAFRAFVAFRPADGAGIVYFANSANGLAIAQQVVAAVVGDMAPTIDWLAYEQSTTPTWAPRRQGLAAEAAGDYRSAAEHFERVRALGGADQALEQRIVWLRDLQRIRMRPVVVPLERLQAYVGAYGPRRLFFREAQLFYQREGRDPFPLIPLTHDLFALEGLVGFRLQVVTDEQGEPTKLVGHYLGGDPDESPRDGPSAAIAADD